MCPICNSQLIPIVYGYMDDQHLELQRQGKIILAGYRERYKDQPKSYCNTCFEGQDISIEINYETR
jgi:hypothetical protein